MTQIKFPIFLSFKIAIISTILVSLTGFWISWSLARKDFYGKRLDRKSVV